MCSFCMAEALSALAIPGPPLQWGVELLPFNLEEQLGTLFRIAVADINIVSFGELKGELPFSVAVFSIIRIDL